MRMGGGGEGEDEGEEEKDCVRAGERSGGEQRSVELGNAKVC